MVTLAILPAIARFAELVRQHALFRHFPTKEAIWEAALEWVAERLLRGLIAPPGRQTRHWPRWRPCS